jgi:ABC-type glycerol-3-phosphate transport system substrate-binding protein
MKAYLIIILLFLLLCIYGCGLVNFNNPTIRFWTNKEEVLPYIEEFNRQHPNYKIEITYLPSLTEDFVTLKEKPDLILYPIPGTIINENQFESLDNIIASAGINKEDTYQKLLKQGVYEERQKFLPFSFDIPVIVFRKQNDQGVSQDFSIDLKDFKNLSDSLTTVQGRRLKTLGFSPLWNSEFLYYLAVIFGADFKDAAQNILSWDENALTSTVEYLRTWIQGSMQGIFSEREFSKKYVYGPMYKLVQDKELGFYRISFFFSTISDYFAIAEEERKNLDFRWLSYDNEIPVNERTLSFAIPKGAKNPDGARFFLSWIYNPMIQKSLIKMNRVNNYGTFGIANGFSILKKLNEHYLPDYYPLLIGLVPPEKYLLFSNQLPLNWEKIKKEIILSWLIEEIGKNGPISPLKDKFQQSLKEK